MSEELSYKDIKSTITGMKEALDILRKSTVDNIHDQYNMDAQTMNDLMPYGISKIENELTDEELVSFYNDHSVNKKKSFEDVFGQVQLRDAIVEIKKWSLDLIDSQNQYDEIQNSFTELLDTMMSNYDSPEEVAKRQANFDKLKQDAEAETDLIKKKEMLNKLDILSTSMNMEFIFTRIRSLGRKEIEGIENGFFQHKVGDYVIKRFKTKAKQLGYDPDIYKTFFNLEHDFCAEEYWDYNNLFLYNYMRYIAYCDPYKDESRLYAQSFTSSIANLVYSKKAETGEYSDNCKRLIQIIQQFDDQFAEDKSLFSMNNTTSPNNPRMKALNDANEAGRRAVLKKNIEKMHIAMPEDVDNMTIKELQDYYNTELDKILNAQLKEYDETKVKVSKVTDEEGNTSTILEPAAVTEVDSETVPEEVVEAEPEETIISQSSSIDKRTGPEEKLHTNPPMNVLLANDISGMAAMANECNKGDIIKVNGVDGTYTCINPDYADLDKAFKFTPSFEGAVNPIMDILGNSSAVGKI